MAAHSNVALKPALTAWFLGSYTISGAREAISDDDGYFFEERKQNLRSRQ